MALEKCPECSAEVSSTAKSCPKCGFDLAKKRQHAQVGCVVGLIVAVVVVVIVMVSVGGGRDEPEPEEILTAAEREQRAWEAECFSAWDGSHRKFVEAVKEHLKSPSSFKHQETRFSTGDFPRTIRMEFDADNAFGASIRHVALGSSTKQCAVEVVAIE